MNKITVKAMQTPYNYEEDYIVVDDVSLPEYFEKCAKEAGDMTIGSFGSLQGLYPAWGNELLHKGEKRFIWKLIEQDEPAILPVLICEDDLDLSCLVLVASVRKDSQVVYWDKLGYVSHANENLQEELESGILYLESYTDEDWDEYGDNIATAKLYSKEWESWISENWEEELYRRRINYTLLYYQKTHNIVWLKEMNWVFSKEEYDQCIFFYKQKLLPIF